MAVSTNSLGKAPTPILRKKRRKKKVVTAKKVIEDIEEFFKDSPKKDK